jgi:hypothetical protein
LQSSVYLAKRDTEVTNYYSYIMVSLKLINFSEGMCTWYCGYKGIRDRIQVHKRGDHFYLVIYLLAYYSCTGDKL